MLAQSAPAAAAPAAEPEEPAAAAAAMEEEPPTEIPDVVMAGADQGVSGKPFGGLTSEEGSNTPNEVNAMVVDTADSSRADLGEVGKPFGGPPPEVDPTQSLPEPTVKAERKEPGPASEVLNVEEEQDPLRHASTEDTLEIYVKGFVLNEEEFQARQAADWQWDNEPGTIWVHPDSRLVFRNRRDKKNDESWVNPAISLNEVAFYMGQIAARAEQAKIDKDIPEIAAYENPAKQSMPYRSVEDFVQNLRTASLTEKGLNFVWPTDSAILQHILYEQLHYLVPGTVGVVSNGMPIPARFLAPESAARREEKVKYMLDKYANNPSLSTLRQEAEISASNDKGVRASIDEQLHEDCAVEFIGVSALMLIQIMRFGLLPGLGAGDADVARQYGMVLPGCYSSPSVSTAFIYPIYSTTGPLEESRSGVSGGDLLGDDGTCPMRALYG